MTTQPHTQSARPSGGWAVSHSGVGGGGGAGGLGFLSVCVVGGGGRGLSLFEVVGEVRELL